MLLFSRSVVVSLSFLTDQTDAGLQCRFTHNIDQENHNE
ncbi:hypothetical protein AWB80_03148 [Caballeronia pedi]|jgi:hypothetical protein|uniref:Uncharacterized protein n=1 Tax=Caballeronia pedi TaxID=1777141 RepID=A0A158B843_9BURK|nr:hypothetical protein AWB80_03148 [Caballeronia pedi]